MASPRKEGDKREAPREKRNIRSTWCRPFLFLSFIFLFKAMNEKEEAIAKRGREEEGGKTGAIPRV
jgi:hypothetical protein